MSQDDDDLGGGTLVMTPEGRPDAQRTAPAGVPRPLPPPHALATEDTGVDQSWDDDASDAPGTFIMNVDHHAQPANPASPFAEASKQSGAWPQAPPMDQVVVGSRTSSDSNIGSAQTLMGMGSLADEVDAALARRAAEQQAGPPLPIPPPTFGAQPAPPVHDHAPHPSYPHDVMQQAGYPQGFPGGPLDQMDPGAFPRPGSYPQGAPSAPAKSGLGPLLLGAAVGLATVTAVVGGYYGYRAFKAPPAAPSAAAPSAAAPSAAPAPGASSAPRVSTPGPGTTTSSPPTSPSASPTAPPATGADAAAKAALERFGEGLKKCVAETIHVLPGTAPAVPSSLAWLKKGPYQPGIRDFESSVYTCSRFKLTDPMPFVFQWQSDDAKGKKGAAIAWIDENGDGTADRALGFTATLEKRNVAVIGPIESFDATRAIKKR